MKSIATFAFEELQEGMEVEIKRLVTAKDIQNFAELTGDFHPLHTSETYAKNNGFSDIIAHGLLLSSFSSTLIGRKLPGENALIMSQNFRYKKPVYPGTELMIKGVLAELDDRFSLLKIKIKITSIDNKELFATGKYSVKVRN